VAASEAINLYG